jgi:hypothetical protein
MFRLILNIMRKHCKIIISFAFFWLITFMGFAQLRQYSDSIRWQPHLQNHLKIVPEKAIASDEYPGLFQVVRTIQLTNGNDILLLPPPEYSEEACLPSEKQFLDSYNLPSDFKVEVQSATQRRQPYAVIHIFPFRKDVAEGKIYKLTRVEFSYQEVTTYQPVTKAAEYAESSVLATGNWVRFGVDTTGIFQLTYDDLEQSGLAVNGVAANRIRIFGNEGAMLPELVSEPVADDLTEIPVQRHDGGDGSFDPGDYLLFYGQSPDVWAYNESNQTYQYNQHTYADTNYYYVTIGNNDGLEVSQAEMVPGNPDVEVDRYDVLKVHEMELKNLLNSGRRWVGEEFDLELSREFDFTISGLAVDEPAFISIRLLAHSTASSAFQLQVAGESYTINIPSVSTSYSARYAQIQNQRFSFMPGDEDIKVSLSYQKSNGTSVGWLDYFEIVARRSLTLEDSQMCFRDSQSLGNDVVRYRLNFSNNLPEVWDVTNPLAAQKMPLDVVGNSLSFQASATNLKEFIAFDKSHYFSPFPAGTVKNQNLHGLGAEINYLIIIPEEFTEEALRLKHFHDSIGELNTAIVTTKAIYNEFSSGKQDISAIRNFVKMVYDRGNENSGLQYLLLFGDGTFDYKNHLGLDYSYVPTYQSPNSVDPVSSFATDDFFAFLDDNEGDLFNDFVDIGVGRLPVTTLDEAKHAVDKIISYGTKKPAVLHDWRNVVCFVGDDEEYNSHQLQANELAERLIDEHPVLNVDKIFFDAFMQEVNSGGQRYPGASEAINTRVETGALIINYTGHGGETSWAHERVLTIEDIQNWTNADQLPVFITATCEFTRFDDPERVSAGEMVFLHRNGGGIALFTTTRQTYGSPNFNLNNSFYDYAFQKINGNYPRMGDLIQKSKIGAGGGSNAMKFILIGDPALRMAYPEYDMRLTHLNGQPIGSGFDTLQALSEVTFRGEVIRSDGTRMDDFEGSVYPKVFDKVQTFTTLGNDVTSYPMDFKLQKNVLYKGKADVAQGMFSFTFIVPKDIDYRYGAGKVSLYAAAENMDAGGYYNEITIGGYNEYASADTRGPNISAYLNDTSFVNGSLTGPNPVLLAEIEDESGINTTGAGIGHDLVAYIDDTENIKVLNDYYQANLNTYKSGKVTYPLLDLEAGKHTLYIKAWDVYNNSSTAAIAFEVVPSDEFEIQRLRCYPNPVSDYTDFVFEHNQKNSDLTIDIRIYDMGGRLVKTISKKVYVDGYSPAPVRWYGDANNGRRLDKGFFVYQLTVITDTGLTARDSGKLILIR